jgi:purine-nucleoside phosphorylase
MTAKVDTAVAAIRARSALKPEIGIILGTGLGGLAEEVTADQAIPYSEIPGFLVSNVASHAGRFILGTLNGRRVSVMHGRFHYYEGYDMADITFPVRVMNGLGVSTLIVTNACGGVNPGFRAGDICAITDHINLTGDNPLRGVWEPDSGPRFPAMANCYDSDLVTLADRIAERLSIPLRHGVYVGLAGPNLETAAECRMVRVIGGDTVGMSTVPEVIVARQVGMKVAGFSVVTNVLDAGTAARSDAQAVTLQDVIDVAAGGGKGLAVLVKEFVRQIP